MMNLRFSKKELREWSIVWIIFEDHFYIHTNHNKANNFKIMRTPVDKTTIEHWEDILPHRKHTLIEDFDLFEKYWVVNEREKVCLD